VPGGSGARLVFRALKQRTRSIETSAAVKIFNQVVERAHPQVLDIGACARPFALLKFRSMRQDAEADGRPVWAAARDDRITRVGGFIRLTRIDELPQLFNVLRGDMSLVGPRPERPHFVDHLGKIIPSYDERHTVLPGITGWAQVNYPYGASVEDARQKLAYDLYYIANRSLLLDLRILRATVGVVIFQKGAR
jgi:lipopolysaccharide/colanic/teichoic acid biosynthesis glycosyltransferase